MNKIIDKLEAFLELGGTKKKITLLGISGVILLLSIFDVVDLPFDVAWIAIILCGLPIILEAIIGLVTEFDIKADVLVSLALIAFVLIGEHFAAGEVAFIMQLGALLEDLTVAKARAGIEKLVDLTPQVARVIKEGKEITIAAEKVQVDSLLRVLPGETVSVDGVIVSGKTSINQAVMTGESMPVDKEEGDSVSSGTVNQLGAFDMKATRVGKDSSIQRMIRLVQSADAGKAKIVGLADRWATWIVVIALVSAGITWAVTGKIIRAVTILVVFCPCALVLATPTAIMAAIGNATKHGFLVREGDALERLARVSRIAFDKTGTLTHGEPEVIAIKADEEKISEENLFSLLAATENLSEHPLGKAVVSSYKKKYKEGIKEATDFKLMLGQGVKAKVEEKTIYAGNEKLMSEENITVDKKMKEATKNFIEEGSTVIFVAMDKICIGFVVLADTLREESKGMIHALKPIDVKPVLLTGDHENAAHTIAGHLDIEEYYADCIPEDKMKYIEKNQTEDRFVCMIGDGINDAPALKKAEVGIAMGGVGSDIAIDAADIALVDDEIKELPHLLRLSKRMMTTIKLNLTFSMALNFVAMALAITGILNPVVGALVHNAGSIIVIINSSLLLKWRKK